MVNYKLSNQNRSLNFSLLLIKELIVSYYGTILWTDNSRITSLKFITILKF